MGAVREKEGSLGNPRPPHVLSCFQSRLELPPRGQGMPERRCCGHRGGSRGKGSGSEGILEWAHGILSLPDPDPISQLLSIAGHGMRGSGSPQGSLVSAFVL